MSIVSIDEQFQPSKLLIVSQQQDPETTITTRLIISDTRVNQVNLLTIEKGPQGEVGPQGLVGPPGKDGLIFDVLPVSSGGTNNTSFQSGYIIYYDGNKLASANISLNQINTDGNSASYITGVIASSGLKSSYSNNNTVVNLSAALGEGLVFDENNFIAVDNTIARVSELSLGDIPGTLPISKGGTNNSFFSQNRLVYFDGSRLRSYPVETGRFLLNNNTSVEIVAGSGLTGGGTLNVPNGSIVLNIPESSDIIIEDNLIKLSNTGIAGSYSKIITDAKGRVVSGSVLSQTDIINILGYTPYHPGNDGTGSNLDADLLDGQHGDFYKNAANLTGTLDIDVLPSSIASPGLYTKVAVNTKGLIEGTYYADQQDIISSLGYTPLNISGGIINNSLQINQNLSVGGQLDIYDNLPLLALNSPNILPSAPRGITFQYGGLFNNKTGILAYYPADNELKLVTNIFASGADINGGATDNNQDDINGGDANSIFIVDNLEGSQATVLLRHIADTLYVTTSTEQFINGLKTFLNGIAVNEQIVIYDKPVSVKPPLDVGGNNLLVTNLNSDYLDNQHGNFYRNASNITGAFDYTKVTFDHIRGTNNFIPKFSDTTNDPAGRITDSNLYQDTAGNVRVDTDFNLVVGGDDNQIVSAKNSLIVGLNNKIVADNSATIGDGNVVSGDNSVALNYRSKTDGSAPNSVAMGSHGYGWLPNQLAIGAFRAFDNDNVSIEHAQQSISTMHLVGTEAHESWRTLQPIIPIPRNKSIAYDIELLISKAFGTGVAHFYFESGIVKNASFRDTNNPINIINTTSLAQQPQKIAGFNNSQIKTHFHTFALGNQFSSQQNINVTNPPLQIRPVVAQNVDPYLYYRPQQLSKTGVYQKLNDGTLILDIDRPLFSGFFDQGSSVPGIRISSKDHKMLTNTMVDMTLMPDPISGIPLPHGFKTVQGSFDQFFYVKFIELSGYLSYSPYNEEYDIGTVVIDQDSLLAVDKEFHFIASGNLSNNTISNVNNIELLKFLRSGMNLKIVAANNSHNRIVSSKNISSSTIVLNNNIQVSSNNTIVNYQGPVSIYSLEYCYHLFKISNRFFVDNYTGSVGQFFGNPLAKVSGSNFQTNTFGKISAPSAPATGFTINPLQNSGVYERLDFEHKPSIAIDMAVSKQFVYRSGLPVRITPLIANTGSATLYHKLNYNGSYNFTAPQFNRYDGVYQRFNHGSGATVFIYNQKLEPISIPFAPITYSLIDGYGDNDNDKFYISGINDQYFLYTKQKLNYEQQDIYSIRIKGEDNSKQHLLEKQLYVYLNDTHHPYLNIQNLPMQSAVVLQPFYYTLPPNVFGTEESGGVNVELTATIKNWHSLPSWLSFNHNAHAIDPYDSASYTFSGIPSGCSLGPQTIRITATNASGYREHIDLRISVVDPDVKVLSFYNSANNPSNDPSIRNIQLSNSFIDENLPASSLVCSLMSEGSYHPYVSFESSNNNFSGIFRNKSDLIEVFSVRNTGFPTVTLTGTPELLATGSIISSMFPSWNHIGSLSPDTKVTHIYKPLVWSGTPLIDSDKVIFTTFDYKYDNSLYAGAKIFTDTEYFDANTTIKNWNDYSFKVNSVILQENEFLLWTENDEVLLHQDPRQTVNGVDTENKFNIFTEDRVRILREDGLSVNTIWASGYEECPHGDLIKGNLFLYSSKQTIPARNNQNPVFTSSTLTKLNPPPSVTLKISSMASGINNLIFPNPINNPVLALYNAGVDEWGELLTEDDEILTTDIEEYSLISDSFFDHGSRIEISNNYELIDHHNTFKNNGKLNTDNIWDGLITEDNQPIVHDYAIVAKKGDAFILFPGDDRRNINIYYPEIIKILYLHLLLLPS